MLNITPRNVLSPRFQRLAVRYGDREYRSAYRSTQLATALATQIRALRGTRTQAQLAEMLDTTQSVISRLENENYGKFRLETLINIADKLDVELVVRFVNFPTFVELTGEVEESDLAPIGFDELISNRRIPEVVTPESTITGPSESDDRPSLGPVFTPLLPSQPNEILEADTNPAN